MGRGDLHLPDVWGEATPHALVNVFGAFGLRASLFLPLSGVEDEYVFIIIHQRPWQAQRGDTTNEWYSLASSHLLSLHDVMFLC